MDHDKYKFDLQVIIFHKEYTNDNAKLALFAFKVLSRFCGGYEVPLNAEKVIMVEKQFALRVFGQGYGCQALRSPYYLSYAAQAIAAGIQDVNSLHPYGKRYLMRSQKTRPVPELLPSKEEVPEDDEEDEGEEGRPSKKIRPSSSSPPASNPES